MLFRELYVNILEHMKSRLRETIKFFRKLYAAIFFFDFLIRYYSRICLDFHIFC